MLPDAAGPGAPAIGLLSVLDCREGTRRHSRLSAFMSDAPPSQQSPRQSGLVVGGQGGPIDELLEDGQEEVFSRTEVEMGASEHQAAAGGGAGADSPVGDTGRSERVPAIRGTAPAPD